MAPSSIVAPKVWAPVDLRFAAFRGGAFAMSQWFNLRADTELGLGLFDEALEDAAIDGGHLLTPTSMAAAHAFKGEMDEAKAAMAEARRLNPTLSPSSGS